MRPVLRHALVLLPLLVAVLLGSTAVPATACDGSVCSGDEGVSTGPGPSTDTGSPTKTVSTRDCALYANGSGMGSYCATSGAPGKTLRERFGGTTFQMCKFSRPPEGLPVPFNANPGEKTWWLRTCLTHVDFDTLTGGPDRRLNIGLVLVDNGEDTTYHDTPLSDFLWQQFEMTAQFPVPFVQNQPRLVPVVNSPTFFTFRWIDPKTKQPVREGPYGDDPDGGPFVRIVNGAGLVMQAEATDIVVSPEQSDMDAVNCGAVNPTYDPDAPPDPSQQTSRCHLTFDRSSATARDKTTHDIPQRLGDVYYASVTVTWKVSYGPDADHLTPMGEDFTAVLMQPLRVEEVQAPNQPAIEIF